MVNSKISGGVDSRVAVKVIRMPSEADAEATARISGLKKEMKFWEQCSLSVSPSRAQLYVKVELAADALSLSFHLPPPQEHVLTFFSAFFEPGTSSSDHDSPVPSIPCGVWLAHELADRSLADVIALTGSVEISEGHMALVCSDVLSALEFLHSRNIVHRDVRSDVLMLCSDGTAKLSDFTHAAQLAPPGEGGKRHSQGVPITEKRTSVVGTAYWMSPEVVKAEPYDVRADIWSLGVVLFEMLEGDPPRVDFPPLRVSTPCYGLCCLF